MTARARRLTCYECAVALSADDRTHYGYQCRACAVREHDLIVLWGSDPDHPDTERLHRGPVDLGLRARPRDGA